MQRAHASQVARRNQALVEKIQARTDTRQPPKACKWSSSNVSRRAGVPDARGRIRSVFTEDEAAIQKQNPNYGGGPRAGGNEQDHGFSTRSIRMFGAMSEDRLIISIVDICKLGDVPRISGMDPPGSSNHSTWYWTTHPATSARNDSGSTWNLQETTSPLSFSPRTRRSCNPIETA